MLTSYLNPAVYARFVRFVFFPDHGARACMRMEVFAFSENSGACVRPAAAPEACSYVCSTESLPWTEANDFCLQRHGTSLATVRNGDDHLQIVRGAPMENDCSWLGLRHMGSPDVMQWDTGAQASFTDFLAGHPQPWVGSCTTMCPTEEGEHCASCLRAAGLAPRVASVRSNAAHTNTGVSAHCGHHHPFCCNFPGTTPCNSGVSLFGSNSFSAAASVAASSPAIRAVPSLLLMVSLAGAVAGFS